MIRNIGALFAGLFAAFVLIYLIQMLGHAIYPPPTGLDSRNPEAMATYVATLPLPALLFPMFAYFIATFAGTLLACIIGDARPVICASVIGTLVLAGTIANLILIPHPLWFGVFAVIGIIASAWLGMLLAKK